MTSEYSFKERNPKYVQQATLCFLLTDNKILLAMKKRGFATGLWNGVGGKVKDEEFVEDAARREAEEEIGVRIKKLEKVALLHFYFPQDSKKLDWNQDVHVFFVKRWEGKPTETEEMSPKWFNTHRIPFKKMWSDDKFWIPRVLGGEKVECWFAFDDSNQTLASRIEKL